MRWNFRSKLGHGANVYRDKLSANDMKHHHLIDRRLNMLRLLSMLMIWVMSSAAVAAEPVYIGLDAEFGHVTSTSAQAVQHGIQIAIDEVNQSGGVLGGRPLKLVIKDNRSITAIGVDNLEELAQMKDLVAVFGGKFSPIYVECIPVAQKLEIPLMDPWGSADQITDHHLSPSYMFRLSLKDSWAAPAFVKFAKKQYGATRLGVLLPNTAWGRSNQAAIEKAAADMGAKLVGQSWYNWGAPSHLTQYQELRAAGAQALILVANENEGATLVKEVAQLPKAERLPIVSHWGVTGGDFVRMTGDALQQVDFSVIQTYSFIGASSPVAKRVIAAMKNAYGVKAADEIRSPVGVAQAYDLTHLLALAIAKAGSTDRRKIRDALEQLPSYKGLIRQYTKPFTPARHDALFEENLFFARYTADDKLIPMLAQKH